MLKLKTFYLAFSIVSIALFCNINLAIAKQQDSNKWKETTAKFEIIKDSIKNLETENTVLGELIKQTGRTLNDLLEHDKQTLTSFKVEYTAPVKLKDEQLAKKKTIVQYGLYRSLAPKMQQYLDKYKIPPSTIQIRYAYTDPVLIEFIINKENIPAPALLTNTIDKEWKTIN